MLFAGDLKGKISIYKSDSHFRPVPIAHFQEQRKAITDVCFSNILYSEETYDASGIRTLVELSTNLFFYSACGTEDSNNYSVHFCSSRGDKGCIYGWTSPMGGAFSFYIQSIKQHIKQRL